MVKRRFVLCVFIIVLMVAFSGCVTENTTPEDKDDPVYANYDGPKPTGELKKFSSAEEIDEFLKKSSIESSSGQYDRSYGMSDSLVTESLGAVFNSNSMINAPTNKVASDYSTTNIQVEDVDEPDFIKNDNKYIYMISGNKLVIVNAYPAENAKIISQTEFNGTSQNICAVPEQPDFAVPLISSQICRNTIESKA